MKNNSRGYTTAVILVVSLAASLLIGWFKPAIQKQLEDRKNKKVEQVQKKEDDQKSAITTTEKSAVVEAHKDVKASGFALADGNIPLATKFNGRADTKLTAVDGGIDPQIVQNLRDEVTNLQSQNLQIRQDAERRLAKSDGQSEVVFQQLTDQRAQLAKIQGDLRVATDSLQAQAAIDAGTAEKYKRLIFAFWAAVGLALAVIGFGLYSHVITVKQLKGGATDVLTRIASFTNDMKTAVGAETHTAMLHNLDINLDDWMKKAVSDARKLLPAPSMPAPTPKSATP